MICNIFSHSMGYFSLLSSFCVFYFLKHKSLACSQNSSLSIFSTFIPLGFQWSLSLLEAWVRLIYRKLCLLCLWWHNKLRLLLHYLWRWSCLLLRAALIDLLWISTKLHQWIKLPSTLGIHCLHRLPIFLLCILSLPFSGKESLCPKSFRTSVPGSQRVLGTQQTWDIWGDDPCVVGNGLSSESSLGLSS